MGREEESPSSVPSSRREGHIYEFMCSSCWVRTVALKMRSRSALERAESRDYTLPFSTTRVTWLRSFSDEPLP